MTHAQPRMPALFNVGRRSAEPVNQEIPEPLGSTLKILRRIQRAEQIVIGNLPVESRYQPLESLMPDLGIDLVLLH